MPVLVNPKACIDREHCYAAAACPKDAYYHNALKRTWEVNANICGDCPGPCLNFCDKDALRWGDDLVDLKFVKAELEGAMTPEDVAVARSKHKADLKAAEEAAKQQQGLLLKLTRANFERDVLRSDLPVVVDCWAAWCAPCRQFAPVFEATAKQYVGVVKFAKLNSDEEPALAQGLGVTALPTLLMFYKGQLVNMAEGALPENQFQSWLYQTLVAVRQYETQLSAEAEDAINAAAGNLRSLDGAADEEPRAPEPSTGGQPAATTAPRQETGTALPGKRTSSGLYIP